MEIWDSKPGSRDRLQKNTDLGISRGTLYGCEYMRFVGGCTGFIGFSKEFKAPQRTRTSNSRDSAEQVHSNGCLENLGDHVPRIPYR